MDDCIFCRIAKGDIPCAKIFEDEFFLGFLDISPVSPGHALLVTKKHYETILDFDEETLKRACPTIKRLSRAIVDAMGADGFNIMQNNKKSAGQIVPHAHFHIIPRQSDDGLHFSWPNKKYNPGEIDDVRKRIQSRL